MSTYQASLKDNPLAWELALCVPFRSLHISKFIEWFWLEGILEIIQSSPSAMSRDTSHRTKLPKRLIQHGPSKDEASKTTTQPVGNLSWWV